ncbi:MAG: nuclear transport factor 2 family protein [Pseudomonadota bacterium]|nr:nuclear transport factor 2 family protein [Pseudomonadota bacterium]
MTAPAESLLQRYAAAVRAKDVEALMALYAEDVRIFDAWNAWSYEGAVAWRCMVGIWFGSLGVGNADVTFSDVRSFGGGDVRTVSAFVRYSAHGSDGVEAHAMDNRLSWVIQRQAASHGESWRIVHEHTSAPVGFSDMKAILQRSPAA